MAVKRGASIARMHVAGFDGGLNLRDAWPELQPNESPGAYNVIFDERGAVVPRLGIVSLNSASLLPQPANYLYESKVASALLAYISADAGQGKLYSSADGGVTWSSVYAGFTAGASGAIVDFHGSVAVVNTLDGVFLFPPGLGAPTHTAGGTNNMDEARGSTIANWKNRLIVGGDPRQDATHSKARLYGCKPGDGTTWNDATESWTNDIVEIDDEGLTLVGSGQGVDINQKPTLYVCKESSAYRVYDDSTGAFTTLHASGAGASNANAAATVLGRIVTINKTGIWETNGIVEPVRRSDNITPLFAKDLNENTVSSWTAGVQGDRVLFNVTRLNGARLQIEYHVLTHWLAAHKGMNLGPMTVYTTGGRKLLGASATDGKIFQVGVGGSDDGTPISSLWASKDFPLLNGDPARLRNLDIWGRGAFNAAIRTDYLRGAGDDFPQDFTGGGFTWDIDYWDQGLWGDLIYVDRQGQPLEEVCRNAQVVISASTSATTQQPALLDDGETPEVGYWGVYELQFRFVPVGFD
jgi:hypothetical protein